MCNKQHPTRRIWTRREILTLFGAVGTTAIAGSVFQSAAANDIYLPIVHNGEAATATATFVPTAVATATPTATPSVTATPVISDFTGITTNGTAIPNLYTISATGVSTEPIRTAAESFIASLSATQQSAALFSINDDEWFNWSNVDGYQREGVSLEEMSDAQRALAFALLGAALSVKGLETVHNTMKLNTTEGEIMNQLSRFNEYLYWFTFMGTPSTTEPWGFQVDGHHLVINYFVLGDQVVMAPVFLGGEPPVATTGTYAGVSILQDEQNDGLALITALTTTQQAMAIISSSKSGNNLQAGANADEITLPYAGIKADALTTDQQTQLLALIELWVGNMRDGHAAVKMAEVEAHLADTYFAWIGGIGADAVFYYRIQSPVILIEFDHETPGPLGNYLGYPNTPSRSHIHAMIRTPNGNDYGKDLLRQHYETYAHVVTPEGVIHVPRVASYA